MPNNAYYQYAVDPVRRYRSQCLYVLPVQHHRETKPGLRSGLRSLNHRPPTAPSRKSNPGHALLSMSIPQWPIYGLDIETNSYMGQWWPGLFAIAITITIVPSLRIACIR